MMTPGNESEPESDLTDLARTSGGPPPATIPDVLPAPGGTSQPDADRGVTAPAAGPLQAFQTSEDISALVSGLAKAQLAFEAIERTHTAQVRSRKEGAASYSYDYADLGTVLKAVRPKLAEQGIVLIQAATNRATSVGVSTLIAHASGQWLRNDLALVVGQNIDPQALGSAITYLRRYSLMALLGVAPEDDDDGAAASSTPNGPARSSPPAAVQQPQRASTNGNGHGHGTGRPNPGSPVPPPAAAAPLPGLPLKRLQKKETTGKGEPYWIVEFGDGVQAVTFSTTWGAKLEHWATYDTRLLPAKTHVKGKWTYLDDVQPAGDGR